MLNEALRAAGVDTGAMSCPYPNHHPALTVLTAAAATDPVALQSFYAALSRRAELSFDAASNCWIAASPMLAQAALLHPDLGVRPPGQAVPAGLQGRPLGAVFAGWLRMRDDAPREAEKRTLQAALDGLDPTLLRQTATRQAGIALGLGWSHWQWASLPCSVAELLGLPMLEASDQQRLLARLAALALALKPAAEPAALDRGDQAVADLLAELDAAAPLAVALQTQTQTQALALLWQGYEAGAGLLGLALLAATRSPVSAAEDLLTAVTQQPGVIHHTRRWALRDCVLAGQTLRAGDALLVMLAGGGLAQPEPLGFGLGRHRCPGITLSLTAAAAALAPALDMLAHRPAPQCSGYQALPNARIPIFNPPTAEPAAEPT
jgi:cytochrome P450